MKSTLISTQHHCIVLLLLTALCFAAPVRDVHAQTDQPASDDSKYIIVMTFDRSGSLSQRVMSRDSHERIKEYIHALLFSGWKPIHLLPDDGDEINVDRSTEAGNEFMREPLYTEGTQWAAYQFGDSVITRQHLTTDKLDPFIVNRTYPRKFNDQETKLLEVIQEVVKLSHTAAENNKKLIWIFVSDELPEGHHSDASMNEKIEQLDSLYDFHPLLTLKIHRGQNLSYNNSEYVYLKLQTVTPRESTTSNSFTQRAREIANKVLLGEISAEEAVAQLQALRNEQLRFMKGLDAAGRVNQQDILDSVKVLLRLLNARADNVVRGLETGMSPAQATSTLDEISSELVEARNAAGTHSDEELTQMLVQLDEKIERIGELIEGRATPESARIASIREKFESIKGEDSDSIKPAALKRIIEGWISQVEEIIEDSSTSDIDSNDARALRSDLNSFLRTIPDQPERDGSEGGGGGGGGGGSTPPPDSTAGSGGGMIVLLLLLLLIAGGAGGFLFMRLRPMIVSVGKNDMGVAVNTEKFSLSASGEESRIYLSETPDALFYDVEVTDCYIERNGLKGTIQLKSTADEVLQVINLGQPFIVRSGDGTEVELIMEKSQLDREESESYAQEADDSFGSSDQGDNNSWT